MRTTITIFCFFFTTLVFSQNMLVDSQSFTPQELVENILIDSECIGNVTVTNVVGGLFENQDQSYGFFDATGTTFPFETGIVLSTGRLANVPGPNDNLSDDDAPGWIGDNDLETILNETNTINATILEFDFTAEASAVSFRYIFASEEYQEDDPNTCDFSDVFGFLIAQQSTAQNGVFQYENIALVPGTNTPVKVTTVHPEIPGGCEAQNEAYFESFNPVNSPTNFAGQTKILTATATIIPNEIYHVKLVIADDQNFRFDSAVFLEAGSFQLSTDLGPNLLVNSGNALCGEDTFTIQTNEPGDNNTYQWFKDDVEIAGETGASLDIDEAGVYSVELLRDTCLLFGEVIIEYFENPMANNAALVECDQDQDGLTTYDLFDVTPNVIVPGNGIFITDFFLTEDDAINNINFIDDTTNFENTIPNQIVFARVENEANCFSIAEVQLQISNNTVFVPTLEACDGEVADGFASFNLNDITASIASQIPVDAAVTFYLNETDAFLGINSLSSTFVNTIPNTQTIVVKVDSNNQCFSISNAQLDVLFTPLLLEDESVIYCLNSFPETITLVGGVTNGIPNNFFYEWLFNGISTEVTTTFNNINEPGIYTVIVTHPNGCSASRMFTVLPSSDPVIEDVLISEGTQNNTVTIIATGDGAFEYALDNLNLGFQTENTFTNVSAGFHTVFVRDINGCGITEQVISVLGFPKFFTPNGDTFNERWQLLGVNSDINQGTTVQIFNRFGKLLTQFTNDSPGWNGTFNGQQLPSDDYWFLVTLIDGRTFTGHFALRR